MYSAHLLPALRLSQIVHLFRGQALIQIVAALSIQNFGWDPCIQSDEYRQMEAEMPKTQKKTVSHFWVLGRITSNLPIRQVCLQVFL